MSPPVFLAERGLLSGASAGSTVALDGEEGRHGVAALRLAPGEPVEVVDGAGRRVSGEVAEVGRGRFTIAVTSVSDEERPQPRITVVQALAKGDRGESAVEMLTECGVDRIVPWGAHRSVAVWRGERADKGLRRWRAVARAAAKQSRRSYLPDIAGVHSSPAVADLLSQARLALVLHEAAAARLAQVEPPTGGETVLVVGPEGGIDDGELELFQAAGGLAVRLGGTVLRTSTAGVAAASVVMSRCGRWD
jgi:16S rRNA (uracil1498-N3)-methyltransferase